MTGDYLRITGWRQRGVQVDSMQQHEQISEEIRSMSRALTPWGFSPPARCRVIWPPRIAGHRRVRCSYTASISDAGTRCPLRPNMVFYYAQNVNMVKLSADITRQKANPLLVNNY